MAELSNIDLEEASRRYNIPLFGVYSKDLLPHKLQKGFGYIINLQDSVNSQGGELPGTHWTALYTGPRYGVYMDSFGFPPPVEVENSLKNTYPNYKTYYKNSTEIQGINTRICGYYCIYFIWYMNKFKSKYPDLKVRLQKFVDEFNETNPSKNRQILENEFKKYFPSP